MLLLLAALQSFEEFRRESFAREDEGAWKKVAWQKDVPAALAAAKGQDKPILAFLVVGRMGQKNAAEC